MKRISLVLLFVFMVIQMNVNVNVNAQMDTTLNQNTITDSYNVEVEAEPNEPASTFDTEFDYDTEIYYDPEKNTETYYDPDSDYYTDPDLIPESGYYTDSDYYTDRGLSKEDTVSGSVYEHKENEEAYIIKPFREVEIEDANIPEYESRQNSLKEREENRKDSLETTPATNVLKEILATLLKFLGSAIHLNF